MLSNFYRLAEAMLDAGHPLEGHPSVKTINKGVVALFKIKPDASIVGLSMVDSAELALKKFAPNNMCNAPVFNFFPLCQYKSSINRKTATADDLYKEFIAAGPPNIAEGVASLKSLMNGSSKLLEIIEGSPKEAATLSKLLKILLSADASKLVVGMVDAAVSHLRGGEKRAADFLLRPASSTIKMQVAFECHHWENGVSSYNPDVWRWIESRLCQTSDGEGRLDAYGNIGSDDEFKAPFPQITFPIIGSRALLTRNEDSPFKRRYVDGYRSFPVSAISRIKSANAAKWIMQPEHEKTLWKPLPVANKKQPGILVGYVTAHGKLPVDADGSILEPLTNNPQPKKKNETSEDEFNFTPSTFESLAAGVKSVLAKLTADTKTTIDDVDVSLFAIQKISKGQAGLVLERTLSAASLARSAEEWDACCKALGEFRVNRPFKGASRLPLVKTKTPKPSDLMRVLNSVYVRGGSHREAVKAFTYADVLSLLLDEPHITIPLAHKMVRAILRGYKSTLVAMAHSTIKGEPFRKSNYDLPFLPPIISLLLSKCEGGKPVMKNVMYQVGYVLNLIGRIQVSYCHAVRKGAIPSSLIPFQFLKIAEYDPAKAIDSANARARPHLEWARRVCNSPYDRLNEWEKKNLGTILRYYNQHGEAMDTFRNTSLPNRLSSTDILQMQAGFFALPRQQVADGPQQQEQELVAAD